MLSLVRKIAPFQHNIKKKTKQKNSLLSSWLQVRDVRLITDNKTRRSKGIAYVEFRETESVPLAMGLSGQKLLSVPIIVQASQAEKNRLANSQMPSAKGE